jgi:hypothetical protein
MSQSWHAELGQISELTCAYLVQLAVPHLHSSLQNLRVEAPYDYDWFVRTTYASDTLVEVSHRPSHLGRSNLAVMSPP